MSAAVGISKTSARAPLHGWFLACLYVSAILLGIREVVAGPSIFGILITLGFNALLVEWAISDSIARGRPIPLFTRDWLFITSSVSLPAYVVWSRGLRGLGWLLLHVFLWYALFIVAALGMWMALRVFAG